MRRHHIGSSPANKWSIQSADLELNFNVTYGLCRIVLFIKLYIKSNKKYICKSHVQNVGHFVLASMSKGQPSELHVMAWGENVRIANISLSHYEFHPDCHVHVYFGSRTSYSRSLFYWHGLTLIPARISNYMHYKVWDQITYHFPNYSAVQPYKFWNGWGVMLLNILLGMWLLIHAEIQVNLLQ